MKTKSVSSIPSFGITASLAVMLGCPQTKPSQAWDVPAPMSLRTSGEKLNYSPLSSETVKEAVRRLEAKEKDIERAATHSWALWMLLNEPLNQDGSLPSHHGDFPKWLTWCTQGDIFPSGPKPFCIEKEKSGLQSRPENYWKSLVFRPKFTDQVDQVGQLNDLLTTHVSPVLAGDFQNMLTSLSNESKCVQPVLLSGLTQCLSQVTNNNKEQANEWLSKAIRPEAMVIKAQWARLRIDDSQSSKSNLTAIIGIWEGAERSWGLDILKAGKGRLRWDTKMNVEIPNEVLKNSQCGSSPTQKANLKTQELKMSRSTNSIDDFFYIQYCDKKWDGWPADAQLGDFFVLIGLHIITNLHPDGDWTWSTLYWHPDAPKDKNAKLDELSERSRLLQHARPENLTTGWRAHYRLDLQYSKHEQIPPDTAGIKAIKLAKESGTDLPCQLNEVPLTPPVAFNPYIEGQQQCGGYSNCMSCHSHAAQNANGSAQQGVNRKFRNSSESKKTLFTHFLWGLANQQI